jgi:beta-lactamase class A
MNIQEIQERNKKLERRWKIVLVIAVLFVLTRPVALYIVNNLIDKAAEEGARCDTDYVYLNESTICEPPSIKKTGYAKTQDELTKYINDEIAAGNLSGASIYFRDLEDGPVWGVNELAEFAPASLLKLPLALVYLSQAERDPKVLEQKLSFPENPPWERYVQSYSPSRSAQPNQSYTVEELLVYMLKYSDNNAYGTLQTYLEETGQEQLIRQTFLELGILAPEGIYDEVVSVRRYASIYRALFNSSFINPDLSEKVLAWLADSDFDRGLDAKLPRELKIANKFGERSLPDGTKQLHDCGIVYYPENPYLICVMTKGVDFDKQLNVINHISEEIYKEVDSRKLE